jgi:hypothetical protein
LAREDNAAERIKRQLRAGVTGPKREALPLATLDRDLEKAAIAGGVALFGA